MPLRCRVVILALWVCACISPNAFAADTVYDVTLASRGTRMWVPPGVTNIKGILIYGNGAGGGSRNEVFSPWNRQLAELHDFAVIGTSTWGNLSGGEITTWEQHLAGLEAASNHPELVNAPWAPIGFSNGGQMSYGFNALRPHKTIAFITNKGCCYNDPLPPAASLRTPGILIAGELDTPLRRNNIRALFDTNRPPRGALWSWVEQENHAHIGRADSIVIPFMDAAIRARYPAGQAPTATTGVTLLPVDETAGWLADQSSWQSGLTKISSFDAYSGEKTRAGWLLDADVAYLYRAFSTYDRDAVLSFDAVTLSDEIASSDADAPTTLRLRLDLSAMPGWTKVELFNYADLVLATSGPGSNVLTADVPINKAGVYGFSALVTGPDGVTVETSNLLAYTALPEPAGFALACLVVIAAAVVTSRATRAAPSNSADSPSSGR